MMTTTRIMASILIFLTHSVYAKAMVPQDLLPEVVNGEVAKTLDEYLRGIESQGFAGAILLIKDDDILLRRGYGYADREGNRKVTADMVFDIGSISKTITGIAILKLQAQGKLDVNDPITRFLKGVPPDKLNITIMQLLQHQSGLQDSFGADEDIVIKEWLVERALNSALLSQPGEKESYSNSGYGLLGAIIENVSGQPYEQFVSEHVLKPAQLKQTGYLLPEWDQRLMVCGTLDGKPWGSVKDYYGPEGPSWHLMAIGGMLSTVTELETWFSALLENKILPESLTNFYVESVAGRTKRGTRFIGTSGANNIFSSQFVRWLDDGATLVLFTSNSEWPYEKVTPKLMEEIGKLMVKK